MRYQIWTKLSYFVKVYREKRRVNKGGGERYGGDKRKLNNLQDLSLNNKNLENNIILKVFSKKHSLIVTIR